MTHYPVSIYFFKVNNGNSREICELCSKLRIKPPDQRLQPGGSIVHFEQISRIILLFPLLILNIVTMFWTSKD